MSTINFLPLTSTIISTDTGSQVRFTLTNNSSKALKLYWIDRAGVEIPFGELAPGQSKIQGTSSSHAWLVKSVDGTVGFKFLPTSAGVITVNANNLPSFTDFSEKVIPIGSDFWSTAQGYGLIDVAKSLGVEDKGELPMNGQNNNMALNAINAPAAWAAGYTGKGVKVAVIDVGIANHAEIQGKIVAQYDFHDKDAIATPEGIPYRDHALGVASIIAASHDVVTGRDTKGVAPDASLINVRVGSGQTGSSSVNIAAGIRYAVDQGAKVICMPLQSTSEGVDRGVLDAVHYAYQKNVVVVIIGGNYGSYGPTGPALIAQQLKGEAIDVGNYNVMAGTAFDSSNMPGANPFPWVMASSSGYVPNAEGGYTYHGDGGTSFAGPYVAGLAALLWQQNPYATASEIMNKIIAGAGFGDNGPTAPVPTPPTPVPPTPVPPAPVPLPPIPKITGTAGNDIMAASAGVAVDGGEGLDLLKLGGNKADYTIATTMTGFSVTHNASSSVNLLTGVERLEFADVTLALDVATGNGGNAYRLYQAAFDRSPDKGGLGYWINALDKGMTLKEVATGFVSSAEFQKLYGVDPTDAELINAMYQNVLNRPADANGLNFWLGAMKNGTTEVDLLISFSNSVENKQAAAEIIGQGFEYTPFG